MKDIANYNRTVLQNFAGSIVVSNEVIKTSSGDTILQAHWEVVEVSVLLTWKTIGEEIILFTELTFHISQLLGKLGRPFYY